jgi:hypothetical protein
MGEGADAIGERGCEGSARWGEVVDDDLDFGKNWVSWAKAWIDRLNRWTYVCAFSREFPCYSSANTSS